MHFMSPVSQPLRSTVAPAYAGSNSCQSYSVVAVLFCLNILMIARAISSKLSVARASIVGPAPASMSENAWCECESAKPYPTNRCLEVQDVRQVSIASVYLKAQG